MILQTPQLYQLSIFEISYIHSNTDRSLVTELWASSTWTWPSVVRLPFVFNIITIKGTRIIVGYHRI